MSLSEFENIVSQTRIGGHSIYFVANKKKWCLRLTVVYREGKSVAFFNEDLNVCFQDAVDFIKANRVKDNEHYRPWRMKTWEELRAEITS